MDDERVTVVKGNQFAAFGVPDAEEMWVKSRLSSAIFRAIEDRKLTRKTVARMLGADEKTVALLMLGRLRNFSTYELMEYLHRLGHEVEIVVRSRHDHHLAAKAPIRISLAEAFEYSIETY